MPKLIIQKSIIISAPAKTIWQVLTNPQYSSKWAVWFNNGSPFSIQSTWKLGNQVLWKDEKGTLIVEGKVTAVEENKLLRFTVLDVRTEKPELTDEDGITFKLTEYHGQTRLEIFQGDFSVIENGKKFYQMSVSIWDKVLPKIKELAETT